MDEQYTLIFPFLDESASFCNGYECGKIAEIMYHRRKIEKMMIHSENIDQITLMAEHYKYHWAFEPSTKGWTILTATPFDEVEKIDSN